MPQSCHFIKIIHLEVTPLVFKIDYNIIEVV